MTGNVSVGHVEFGNGRPISVVAGPCQVESVEHAVEHAGYLDEVSRKLGIGFVYKSSFDKANRTSGLSPRGLGIEDSLRAFAIVRHMDIPVVTDVHEVWQVGIMQDYVDALQVPALLSRQTDLLRACGETGLPVLIKKGQFMDPRDMAHARVKVEREPQRPQVLLVERGTTFGYGNLVVDMRSLRVMSSYIGRPVIFDATHSVQQPSSLSSSSGGVREMVAPLARAAVAVGVAGVFFECHVDPDNAPSDGPCMLRLADVESFLTDLMEIDYRAKARRMP